MKFLIDECLHTFSTRAERTFGLCASLVELAHKAGHLCDHVNFLGLSGYKDCQLMTRIRSEECAFITNNRVDFTELYGREESHAGLVIIVCQVTPARQRELSEPHWRISALGI